MLNAALNVALITLAFVWDKALGNILPLSTVERWFSPSASKQREVA